MALTEKLTQDLAARRRDIVRAVADLSEKHDLPMPMSIDFEPTYDQIHLHLDPDSPEAVERWTDLLDNGPVKRTRVTMFVCVASDSYQVDGPTWFDAGRVYITSYLEIRDEDTMERP